MDAPQIKPGRGSDMNHIIADDLLGSSGAADLGMAQALLEEIAINSTIEPPELTQDWGNTLLEGTNRTLCAPGPRRKEQ